VVEAFSFGILSPMDTQRFKQRLEEELALVEKELGEIAVQDPTSGQWQAKTGEIDVATPMADANESADALEEYDEHREELPALTGRWNEVKHALEKIDRNTYGKCEADGEPIEEERLEANPAARTCTKHL
jgi:RNA polymerase-binding transcription factor DksA